MLKKVSTSLLLSVLFITVAVAQNTFTGTVVDTKGETLVGVNVVIDGTTIGTVTDIDGKFRLDLVADKAEITISFIGYLSQTIIAMASTPVNIVLEEDVLGIDEVVIVGYGVQKKSLVTGAISNVKAEDIATMPSARVDQAIQGRSAGVAVMPTSGAPGSGTKIRIRGTNSNGNSNPLFIVDGMKTGDIDNIDPANIESVELLKDAASAAIYGTEGANGVILITTKTGKQTGLGRGTINYNFQYGIQSSRTQMELMNASEYTTWMDESGAGSVSGSADTDWIDEVFETAPMMKHNISFSGGSAGSSYLLSTSYYTQDGIVGGDKAQYDRFNVRINGKKVMNRFVEVGNSLAYSHSKQKYIGEDDEYRGVINNMLLMDPLTPVTYSGRPDNVAELEDAGNVILKDENGNYYGLAENVTGETANPIAVMDTYHNEIQTDKLLGMIYGKVMPFDGFTFTSRFGIDMSYQNQHYWTPEYYFSSESSNGQSSVDDNLDRWYTWLWENFATYNYATESGHNFMGLLGYSAQDYRYNTYSLHSAPMVKEGDQYAYHDHVTSRDFDQVGSDYTNNTMTSIFGRLSYSYNDKYMLEASLRRDAASVFPENNKSAIFPAFSGGWVVSEEDWASFGPLGYVKLRASWGENGSKGNLPGNEDKEFWAFSNIRIPNGEDSYYAGTEIDKLVNTDLVWETTQQFDVGLDLRAFDGRLNFSVDYYNKKTIDLLVEGQGPLSVGNEYPYVNAGDVTNKGFDFEIGFRNNDNAFKYDINLNLSTQNNEVTNLAVDAPIPGDNLRGYDLTWFEEGYPIWYFKGYKTNGIDSNGDVIVEDVSGDGEITAADQTYIGDPHADVLYGGNMNFSYNGLDLGIFFQGTTGNDIFMGWFRTDRKFSNKPKFMYDERWTSSNAGGLPAANNSSDYIYRSDLMVQDGSYLRIKQIQLGYTLPRELLSSVGISKFRVYASLDDYFTITGYEGLDPETGSSEDNRQGVDRGVYPVPGKMMFGLSVSF